jgi:regulator of sirC expression with transglutaminase-like and TPR domain
VVEEVAAVARARLEEIAALPGDAIDLAEAALWIAAEEYDGLDVAGYLARLDGLAAAARAEIGNGDVVERVERLNRFLFVDCDFAGNEKDYYDPRNSFLNEVVDRRLGIPITLSLVYCEVARRVGLAMAGVGFPGHFLVRHSGEPEILVDPFFRRTVDAAECERRLRAAEGRTARLDPRHLLPTPPRDVLARMLRNLKHAYLRRDDAERALAAVDRTLLFAPDDPMELRDRGLLYFRLECFGPALADLRRFLHVAPTGPAAEEVRLLLPDVERRAAELQ